MKASSAGPRRPNRPPPPALGHDLQLVAELEVASALREPGVFFTEGELEHFAAASVPLDSLAGGFAAKEALFKALPAAGTTWFWTDAELVHDEKGAPCFAAHGPLAEILRHHRLRVAVSISHSGGFVSAVVLVTAEPPAHTHFLGTIERAVRRAFRSLTTHPAGAPQ